MIGTIFKAVKALVEETNSVSDEIKNLDRKYGSEMKIITNDCEQAILAACENPRAHLNMKSKEARPNSRNLLTNLERKGYDCENIVYMKYLCGFMFASSSLKEIARIIAEDIGMKKFDVYSD